MGLFSRKDDSDASSELLESPGLPNSLDLQENYFEPDLEARPIIQAKSPRRSVTYGIEDAINLMRKLPSDNLEVVVSVVKQTLESTQISVDDIIADANDKEERLLSKNTQLEKEIQELQHQISSRNQQIAKLLEDHKETVVVRERLQLANQLNERATPAKTAAKAAAKPEIEQELKKPGVAAEHQTPH